MKELTPYEIGYLAAVLDRNGSFSINRRSKSGKNGQTWFYWDCKLRFSFSSSHKAILDYVKSLLPTCSGSLHKNTNPHNIVLLGQKDFKIYESAATYTFTLSGDPLDILIEQVFPCMRSKKKECGIFKEFRSTIKGMNYGPRNPISDEVVQYRLCLIEEMNKLRSKNKRESRTHDRL